jgi:hypothetical protein
MTIDVDIRVQDGKVTITVGGHPSANAAGGQIVAQGNVGAPAKLGKTGGDGAAEDPGPGSGGPGTGSASGVVVIGPIVVGGSMPQGAPGNGNPNSGKQGGDGAAEDPGPGSGPPTGSGFGALVIGPIVIGGGQSGVGQNSGSAALPPAQGVDISPT